MTQPAGSSPVVVECFYNDNSLKMNDIIYTNPTNEFLHVSIKNDQGDELVEWEQQGPGSGTIPSPNVRCITVINEYGQEVVVLPEDLTEFIEWG